MSAKTFDTISFWSLYAVIVLLPVFFLPFTRIPVETGKGLLVVGGLTLAIIAWSLGRFIDGKVVIPRSKALTSGLLVVAVFFISSMTSPARDMSLFGLMFDLEEMKNTASLPRQGYAIAPTCRYQGIE
jgi:hypothetical protein